VHIVSASEYQGEMAHMKYKSNRKLNEECAVFGISTSEPEAVGITYNGLLALQHRGQEGSGIAVAVDNRISCHKNAGLVSEVFGKKVLQNLPKVNIAIGHNRYSTTGGTSINNIQPFISEYLTGRVATVHNGNISNASTLKSRLTSLGLNFHATSDSEVVSALIAHYYVKYGNQFDGLVKACDELQGAFSLIVLWGEGSMMAVRDPHGYRPLCLGKNSNGIAVASESCALDSCGFEFLRDVAPGEVVVIEDSKITHSSIALKPAACPGGLCIFEYVYFARPDSVIDQLSVYEARYKMGEILASEHPVQADAVCGVPDSGIEAALGYAAYSGIPLVSGFVKNRYIGRSFIYPVQSQRENAVHMKLNPLRINLEGKRIVLVDDSIVRGTTSEKIVRAMKDAGASEVHMRISSPPFLFRCNFGTDIDNEENLIANKMDLDEIRKKIGADSLGYISIEGLKNACRKSAQPFCTECFTGVDILK
jgi:amidophosphoribosyltransferase